MFGTQVIRIYGVAIVVAVARMVRDKGVVVIDLHVRSRIMQLHFLPDIGVSNAIIMNVFVKTCITILIDRRDDMLLDLITDRIKRA